MGGITRPRHPRRHITDPLQAPEKDQKVFVVPPDGRAARVRQDGTLRERLGLGVEIDLRVHVGRIDRDMPEPRADGIDVDTSAQEVGRGRMTTMPDAA